MSRRFGIVVAPIVIGLLGLNIGGAAFGADLRAGEPVVLISFETGLKEGDHVVVPPRWCVGSVFWVERIDGNRVRLAKATEPFQSGWVERDQVVALMKAGDFFTEQIKAGRAVPHSYLKRAAARFAWRQYELSRADAEEAIRRDPRMSDAYIARAEFYYKTDKAKAIESISEAIRRNPDQAVLYCWRAVANTTQNEADRAIEDLTAAVRLDPKDPVIRCLRASVWMRKKEIDKALAEFSEAIRLESSFAAALDGRGLCWAYKEQFDQSLADLSEAIRIDPQISRFYVDRAFAWQGKNELGKALNDLAEAVRLEPNAAINFSARGQVLANAGKFDQAITDFTEAIRLSTPEETSWLRFRRGEAWLGRGEIDKARADFEEAERLNRKRAPSYATRGYLRDGKGDAAGALSDYSQAILLGGCDARVYVARARIFRSRSQFDRALADLSEALALEPDNVQTLTDRGLVYYLLHDQTRGRADLERVLRSEPVHASEYATLARILAICPDAALRDGKKAVLFAMRACELSRWTDPRCLATLAVAYAEAGDFTSALKWIDEAIERTARNASDIGQFRMVRELFRERKPYRDGQ